MENLLYIVGARTVILNAFPWLFSLLFKEVANDPSVAEADKRAKTELALLF